MKIIDSLQKIFSEIEPKKFYIINSIVALILFIIAGGSLYFGFSRINVLQNSIFNVNNERINAQLILQRLKKVKLQQAKMNELISQDSDFKINFYIEETLKDLNLNQNLISSEINKQELNGQYQAVILTTSLENITMQSLVEFLNKIYNNSRLYIKNLEIKRSTKQPKSINTKLEIATLQMLLTTSE